MVLLASFSFLTIKTQQLMWYLSMVTTERCFHFKLMVIFRYLPVISDTTSISSDVNAI